VVFAGRLLAEKGVQDLLAAAPELRVRHPGTRFVVAGDGPYRAALIDQARRRKLHRAVSFPGHLDRETLAAVLGAADAVVLPSRYEPSGMIALEAAAAGAPLAVAATGALASIVEAGRTGVLFPAGDVAAIVEATSGLLSDPLLAETLAARAREMVRERHAWPVVAARTAEVYAAAVEQAPTFEASRTGRDVGHRVVLVPPGNLLAGAPRYGCDASDDADDDVFDLAELDAVADDPAWVAGAQAGRDAVRAGSGPAATAGSDADRAAATAGSDADRAAAERDAAERQAAKRVSADALDIVLATSHRALT
jgi:glycogen synthase